ncbi:hypothetical protein K503DRAFT_430752 [Rhizopogon vinicolor AM-OR11-026]|uniref:Uncharacterized protein n=1 Tax=Rhizopogon vinicolor AM-OR11-026 TaxID=1314800 RepID=A0A1B7MPR7_9AGAM|nr:hypothetical protein K503DRAFT_430752 [Rhizopogon vinicolor AM-OR11-026]
MIAIEESMPSCQPLTIPVTYTSAAIVHESDIGLYFFAIGAILEQIFDSDTSQFTLEESDQIRAAAPSLTLKFVKPSSQKVQLMFRFLLKQEYDLLS